MIFRVGIDCGGTFTDGISVDEEGRMVTAKEASTPKDLTIGVRNTLASLARNNNLTLKEFLNNTAIVIHGTTVGTNTILTRSGAKTGLIATTGYRDCIEFRRIPKADMFNGRMPCPKPLVPRHLRVEVEERVDWRGHVKTPLNEESVRQAIARLKREGVESIAVSLLFSFLNSSHERRVNEVIREDYPEAHVSLSSTVWPAISEFERTSTTAIDAYIGPGVRNYISVLHDWLKKEGFRGEFLLMQSNGGVGSWNVAVERAATLAVSGPAAAPSAALTIGKLHGEDDLMSVDMGGTSFDFLIIDKGRVLTKTESVISDVSFALPSIDVSTLGAGGGSIAWFDVTNTLRVGPQSAGASPGPACYGKGGEEATVTDANVVLGYISPDFFLGGQIPLRKDLADKAIKTKVADRLGISTMQAAAAIYKIINSCMADSASSAFAKRGYDPRDFTLCVAGAAGPAHGLRLMQELGIKRVLIPKLAPVYCAFGMTASDLRHDHTRFYYVQGQALDLEHVKKLYREMEAEGEKTLEREGVPKPRRRFVRSMDLRYFGQFREVEVELPDGPITEDTFSSGVAAFHARHGEMYGYSDKNYPIEFMNFKLSAIGTLPGAELKRINLGSRDASGALKNEREAFFEEEGGLVKTRVYDGERLLGGNLLEGPCVVEEKTTTIVIPPGFIMRVDEYGNYITD
jgi:N-methylhydantoinase A